MENELEDERVPRPGAAEDAMESASSESDAEDAPRSPDAVDDAVDDAVEILTWAFGVEMPHEAAASGWL